MNELMIVAGEVSGDIHAGNLLRELTRLRPSVSAFGVGGDRLEEAGLDPLARIEELAHMGLFEVLRELPRIRALMGRLVEAARQRRPALAILVDSPDFNLRLAKRLRRLGIPVVLYVSPQLWAWRRGRVRTVRRLAEEVLCILPFEVEFYERHGVPARYVGHPLVDDVQVGEVSDADAGVDPGRLALMPGSRAMEVRQLLPTMLRALRELPDDMIREAILVEAPGLCEVIDRVLHEHDPDSRLRRIAGGDRRRLLASSAVAWTASGTATLECALLDVPMVVGYRLNALSFAVASLLVKVDHVALVNLIAGERAVPELIQGEWTADALVGETRTILKGRGTAQKTALAKVRRRLGDEGASRRAAEAILSRLDGQIQVEETS